MIIFHHVSYSYQPHLVALNDINLAIESGERVALVGANGAGKTTLLLHLNGILLGEGLITINGLKMEKGNLPAIRASVGMLFQSPDDQLFSASVFKDVAYAPIYQGLSKKEVSRRVESSLALVGLEGFDDRAPYRLSLGEKKRAALATVLAMNPPILALDEPTAGLDPRGRREFITLLQSLPGTLIAATHDMAFVQSSFPRVVVLNQGRIVYDGLTNTAFKNRNLLQENGLI